MTKHPGLTAVQDEYARLAADYDCRWSAYVAATSRATLRRLELKPGDRLLDVGCGTGVLLDAVVRTAAGVSIVGIDVTPEMLRLARRRLGCSVPLVTADVERLSFAAATFDVAVSSSSFHYWPHPAAGLKEIARVLRPGGALVITDWCDDYLTCRVYDLVLRLVDRAHHRSYSREECRRWLDEAGYDVHGIERYKIDWFWGLMTATALKATDPRTDAHIAARRGEGCGHRRHGAAEGARQTGTTIDRKTRSDRTSGG